MSRLWIAGLLLVSPFGAAPLQAQWTIAMRPMQNPLAVGQCTAIEIVVKVPAACRRCVPTESSWTGRTSS